MYTSSHRISRLLRYPNFPGFSTPFLEWLFDTHDLNNDGSLTQAEFTSASKSMYPAPLAPDNWLKNTDDGIAARTPNHCSLTFYLC